MKKDYNENAFDYSIETYNFENWYSIKVSAKYKEFSNDKDNTAKMLVLNIYPEWNEIQIPNIFLPRFMHYNGIGKKMLFHIFEISQNHNYEVCLVDMVPSFYNRMLKRGALNCGECFDAVQLTKETKFE